MRGWTGRQGRPFRGVWTHYNDAMLALRFVAALAVAVWLGGTVAIASVVAPSAFSVLTTSQAALLVGETLRRFHLVSYGAGVVVLAAFAVMAVLGPRPRAFGLRLATVVAMLVATLISGLWIDRRIAGCARPSACRSRRCRRKIRDGSRSDAFTASPPC